MVRRAAIFIIMIVFIFGAVAQAADFQDNLTKLVKENGKSYVQPLLTGFGTAVNSGLYKKASVKPGKLIPIGFDVGIVTSTAIVPDEDKTYKYTLDMPISIQGQSIDLSYADVYEASTETTPTIASDKKGTTLERKDNQEIINAINAKLEGPDIGADDVNISQLFPQTFKFPDGLNVAAVPMFALQANVRIPFIGLEVTGRGFPEYKIPDVGKLSFLGGGLRKSIPVPIIDLTAGAFYQVIGVGDFFEVENYNYHLEVGKDIGLPFLFNFSPYAGLALDQTKGTLEYTVRGSDVPGMEQDQKIKYDFKGKNQLRMTAGLTAQIIPLTYVNLELAQGQYFAGTLSIGLIFK